MNKSEIYLIVFWENAGVDIKLAETLIKKEGFNCKLTTGELAESDQLRFVKRLYYSSVTNFSAKIERVGAGEIIVGVVEDSNPNYQLMHTTRGYSSVNKNILTLKKKLRRICSVNDGVHLSDTLDEAKHNLFVAFSKEYAQLKRSLTNLKFQPKWITCISDVFSLLNVSLDYVVQRNFHEIFDRTAALHGDIDLLVRDTQAAALLIDAKPSTNDETRKLYEVTVGASKIKFDLRDCEENYYCPSWAEDILRRRIISKCGTFFRPNDQDLIYMVAYHALFHKFELKDDYLTFIKDNSSALTDYPLSQWDNILRSLARFLEKRKYEVSIPKDRTVKLNPFHYVATGLTDNSHTTRKSFLPEHHARSFVNHMAEKPKILFNKDFTLSHATIFTREETPWNLLVCKSVVVNDLNFAPYLLNEGFQLELYGNKHAPKVFSYFFKKNRYFILMERVNGIRLDKLFQNDRKFLEKNSEKILMELDSAELLLKNKGIQHRDIREKNMFITPKIEVKLIDFGLSCSIQDKNAALPAALKNTGNDCEDFNRIRHLITSLSR
ncbi:protein kinase [Paracoccaceae bacterium]|nr:protein kinase [Paracoccaceae bacterium]